MQDASRIEAAMGLVLDCDYLKLDFQSLYDGIGEATEASAQTPDYYGCKLWTNLIRRGAFISALDLTIDRLPPGAFGRVTPNIHMVALMKEWATYGAPNIFHAYLAFKRVALEAGWKPSQVNNYLVVGLRMEETMMGEPFIAKDPPNFTALDQSDLNPRERRVADWMSTGAAH